MWFLGDRCHLGAWHYSDVLPRGAGPVQVAGVQPSPSRPPQVCLSTLATGCGTARWRSAPGRRPSTRAPTSATMWTSTPSPWTTASPTPLRARATRAGVPLRTRASHTSKWQEQRKANGQVASRKAKAGTNRRRRLSSPTMSWTTRPSSGAGSRVSCCPTDEEGSPWLPPILSHPPRVLHHHPAHLRSSGHAPQLPLTLNQTHSWPVPAPPVGSRSGECRLILRHRLISRHQPRWWRRWSERCAKLGGH